MPNIREPSNYKRRILVEVVHSTILYREVKSPAGFTPKKEFS